MLRRKDRPGNFAVKSAGAHNPPNPVAFISYTREDGRAIRDRLVRHLNEQRVETIVDDRMLMAGGLSGDIERSISEAGALVPIITPATMRSDKPWVRREIHLAETFETPIYPIHACPGMHMLEELDDKWYVDATGSSAILLQGVYELAERLRSAAGHGPISNKAQQLIAITVITPAQQIRKLPPMFGFEAFASIEWDRLLESMPYVMKDLKPRAKAVNSHVVRFAFKRATGDVTVYVGAERTPNQQPECKFRVQSECIRAKPAESMLTEVIGRILAVMKEANEAAGFRG